MTASASIENRLLQVVREFLIELDAMYGQREIKLYDSLQRHLGLDSISSAELFTRIEKAFGIHLPNTVMNEADTLKDLAKFVAEAATSSTLLYDPVEKIQVIDTVRVDPAQAETLNEVLALYARISPNRPHIHLQDDSGKMETITYHQLFSNASQIAYAFIQLGLQPGDAVAIMQPTNAGFFYSFMGVLLAGGIPVPIYPPARIHQLEEYAKKEAKILCNANARFLVTFKEAKVLSRLLKPFIPSLKGVVTVDELLNSGGKAEMLKVAPDDLALIQFTSGSTSDPKGIPLTHRNILANIRAYGQAIQIVPEDVTVSWLPLYHDLGLIGNWLGSFYYGTPLVAFSPLDFLNHPEKWLWNMHYHRATVTAGPNFAYELCVRKIDTAMLEGLDLSAWRLALNGAEMIYPETIERFSKKFAPYGFKPETFLTVYGLAENTLGLTTPPLGRKTRFDRIDRVALETAQKAVPTTSEDQKHSVQVVSCGMPLSDNQIRIVDKSNRELPERSVGRLQFKSPSMTKGYYNNPEATKSACVDGWMDTGDLAYLADHELYLTGRRKDMIIKAGQNLFPAEIENLVSDVPDVRRGCVIAFSANDPEKGTDQMIVVAEVSNHHRDLQQLKVQITEKIVAGVGTAPDKVILVPPRTIPKTSSGKLRRSECKKLYLENKLGKKTLPVWMQLLRVSAQSFSMKAFRGIRNASSLFYVSYMAVVIGVMLLPLWLIVRFASRDVALRVFQQWVKLIAFLSFCPQRLEGLNNLTKHAPVIFVSNHASYCDGMFLSSFLPHDVAYIGKKELFRVPFLRTLLNKFEYISVDKFDFAQGMEDMKQVERAIEQGRSVVIFPEGTFGYSAGLRPFKLGAFKIAAEMHIPICPISISGTRELLRGKDWFALKKNAISAVVGEPMYAEGNEWKHMIELRNRARAEIAKHCGEPALDFIISDVSAMKNAETESSR